ncbi:MAG: hypothetical protein ABMA26_08040 [Limisphaerales bacterium]
MTPDQRHQHYVEVINPRLQQLGGRICDASGIDDEVLEAVAYQNLVSFYEEQVAAGHWHPSFTESMGDFTTDDTAALVYYRRALDEARRLPDQTHSILLCMAERLNWLGQMEQAEACLADGRAEAVRRGDNDCIEQADRILKEMTR